MATPSPICKVNGLDTVNGVLSLEPNTDYEITLNDVTGVTHWSIKVISTDDKRTVSDIPLTVDYINKKATFKTPNERGVAIIFKSTINNGVDANGVKRPDYHQTFKVGIKTTEGYHVAAFDEGMEHDNEYGWLPILNDTVRAIGSGGSGGSGSGIKSVDTLDDLRAVASVDLDNDSIYLVQETGHLWKYEANTGANEIDDSNLSVKPNDVLQANNGRWRPVISHGKPGIAVGTVTLPTSYLPAGLNIIGAKPIVDGSPGDPWHFVGFAVDRGDTAGVKNPYPIFGLNEEGAWVFVEVDMSTMQEKEFYEFRDNEFRIVTHPTDGAKKIAVYPRGGASDFTSDDLDLSIEAANTSQDNITQAGSLTLKGGDHWHTVGTGGDVLIKPGRSGGSAARLGISALCDEDGVPVVAASKDMLSFFNGTLTGKPTVTGDWGDGSAGLNLATALSNLGLITDSTTNNPSFTNGEFRLLAVSDELDVTSTINEKVYEVPACNAAIINRILVVTTEEIDGIGNITMKVGTSSGDDDLLITKNVSVPYKGILEGHDISEFGTTLNVASTGYEWIAEEGDEIWITVNNGGTITDGKIKVYVYGVIYE